MLKYKTAIKSWCAQIYASIKLIQASKKQRKATNLSESLRVSQNQHIPISTRPIPIYIYPNLIPINIILALHSQRLLTHLWEVLISIRVWTWVEGERDNDMVEQVPHSGVAIHT